MVDVLFLFFFFITLPEGGIDILLAPLTIFRPLSLSLPSTCQFAKAHVNKLIIACLSLLTHNLFCWLSHFEFLTTSFKWSLTAAQKSYYISKHSFTHSDYFILTSNNSSPFLTLSWWSVFLLYWEYRGNHKGNSYVSNLPAIKSTYSAFPPNRRDVFPVSKTNFYTYKWCK